MPRQQEDKFLRLTPSAPKPYLSAPVAQPRRFLELTPVAHPAYQQESATTKRKRSHVGSDESQQMPKRAKSERIDEPPTSNKRKASEDVQDVRPHVNKKRHDATTQSERAGHASRPPTTQIPETDAGAAVENWYPEWWYPSAIQDSAFFKDGGFVLVGGKSSDGFPCLMFNAELFRIMWAALTAGRQAVAAKIHREDQYTEMAARVKAIDADNVRDIETFHLYNDAGMQLHVKDPRCNEILEGMRQLKDDIRERNEERDLLNQCVDTIIKRSDAAAEKARNLHKAMVEQLDVHFDNLGVLPKLHDIKAAPDVLVSGPAMAPDATATKEPQQPEANLNEVEVLTQAWNAILDKLLEIHARFERFRDSFDAELQCYIAEQLFE
jgi:hypothetical protein